MGTEREACLTRNKCLDNCALQSAATSRVGPARDTYLGNADFRHAFGLFVRGPATRHYPPVLTRGSLLPYGGRGREAPNMLEGRPLCPVHCCHPCMWCLLLLDKNLNERILCATARVSNCQLSKMYRTTIDYFLETQMLFLAYSRNTLSSNDGFGARKERACTRKSGEFAWAGASASGRR